MSSQPELIVESDRIGNSQGPSRVDANYFDPQGFQELQRALSHDDPKEDARSAITDSTIDVDDNFDFGRKLQRIVKKWANRLTSRTDAN